MGVLYCEGTTGVFFLLLLVLVVLLPLLPCIMTLGELLYLAISFGPVVLGRSVFFVEALLVRGGILVSGFDPFGSTFESGLLMMALVESLLLVVVLPNSPIVLFG